MVYGLAFGGLFSLAAWGYDALIRGSHHGSWPALSFVSAAPLLLAACGVAGRVLRRSDDPRAWVWIWLVVGAVAGGLVSLAPSVGHSVATWIAEPGLAGIAVRPMPPELRGEALLYALLMAGVGTIAGLVGHAVAWQSGAARVDGGRPAAGSWVPLLVCVPIALMPGLAGDRLMNSQTRAGVVSASDGLSDRIRDRFVVHPVSRGSTGDDQMLDVVLDDGFAMRCTVSRGILSNCTAVSSSYRDWMRTIADSVRLGDPSDWFSGVANLGASPSALDQVAGLGDVLSGRYTISRDAQYGSWVVMSASFTSSAALTCYFHGHAPVVLNHCRAG